MLLTRRHVLGGLGAAAALPLLPAARAGTVKPYVHFCMNVHDWGHPDESAATVARLAGIYKKHGVKGDFFVNAFMVDRFAARYPDAIRAISENTLSYAIRPPHPLYAGFSKRLAGLDSVALEATLRDYETFAIDQSTGELDRTRPGGFIYSTEVFGRAPVSVTTLNPNQGIRAAAARVYKSLGAKVTVAFHEAESDPDNPWQSLEGLVVRPSHVGLVRYGGSKLQWWNNVAHGDGELPSAEVRRQAEGWTHAGPPFLTVLMHENNFTRNGPESWTLDYYADEDKKKPLSPPFSLSAADKSRPRKAEAMDKIWAAYDDLVGWAAKNATVITSEDLVAMAPKVEGAAL